MAWGTSARSKSAAWRGTSWPVEPFYTLSNDGDFGVADPTFRALKSLVPGTDKGWVIVRHHATHSHAEAYIEGAADLRPLAYPNWGQMLWQSADGFVSLRGEGWPARS